MDVAGSNPVGGSEAKREATDRMIGGSVLWKICLATAVVAAGIALYWVQRDDAAAKPLTVQWESVGDTTACVADRDRGIVTARLRISGTVNEPDVVTVTVTAHADENTSQPIGSTRKDVSVSGDVDEVVLVPIAVDGEPHRGEDGGTACSITVSSRSGSPVLLR